MRLTVTFCWHLFLVENANGNLSFINFFSRWKCVARINLFPHTRTHPKNRRKMYIFSFNHHLNLSPLAGIAARTSKMVVFILFYFIWWNWRPESLMHCHHHHRAKHIRINLAQIADSKRATDSDNALMPANKKWKSVAETKLIKSFSSIYLHPRVKARTPKLKFSFYIRSFGRTVSPTEHN